MIRILLAGFYTAGAIRYAIYTLLAGVLTVICAVGMFRVAVGGGDWSDSAALIVLAALGLFGTRRQYRNTKAAVVAASMKARGR